jgi:hypothetical protein
LNGSHQGELEKTALGCIPQGLIDVAQIESVGLKRPVLLERQRAEKERKADDDQQYDPINRRMGHETIFSHQ